jgi:hypothetical protein
VAQAVFDRVAGRQDATFQVFEPALQILHLAFHFDGRTLNSDGAFLHQAGAPAKRFLGFRLAVLLDLAADVSFARLVASAETEELKGARVGAEQKGYADDQGDRQNNTDFHRLTPPNRK